MLNKAFDGRNLEGLIFHSDQGWQYQHQSYQQRLKNKGIKQSKERRMYKATKYIPIILM